MHAFMAHGPFALLTKDLDYRIGSNATCRREKNGYVSKI